MDAACPCAVALWTTLLCITEFGLFGRGLCKDEAVCAMVFVHGIKSLQNHMVDIRRENTSLDPGSCHSIAVYLRAVFLN